MMHAPSEAKTTKKTTGWSEETRNIFHPGDIITALRLDFAIYSPSGSLGLVELACHCSGEGREFCQPHISDDGIVEGFYGNVRPRAEKAQLYLKEMFPEIARFAKELANRDLKKISKSPEKMKELYAEIESKFGNKIEVPVPKLAVEERKKAEKEKNQQRVFFEHPIRRLDVAVVDPSKSDLASSLSTNPYSQDHYQVLNVLPSASTADIKTAYKQLALRFHPDKNSSPEALSNFIKIAAAFEVLGDSQKRLRYDLQKYRLGSAYSKPKAICFSDSNSNSNAQLDEHALLLWFLLFSSTILYCLPEHFERSSRASNSEGLLNFVRLQAMNHGIEPRDNNERGGFFYRSLMNLTIFVEWVCSTTFSLFQGSIINNDFSNDEMDESRPDNFFPAAERFIHGSDQDSGPAAFARALSELTDEERALLIQNNVPRTDFFDSSEKNVVNRIKKRLGMSDGDKLIRMLLTKEVPIKDVEFYSDFGGDDGFTGILIPKSSITNLWSFLKSLKELSVSIGRRLLPVAADGDFFKIDFSDDLYQDSIYSESGGVWYEKEHGLFKLT
jgi:curved DNA-binding protein CbpA